MRRAVERYDHEGIEVLVVADDIRPFSFEGRIVMSESDDGPDREMILRHEATHIRERHGADLAAVNLAAAVLWFNPFVWLLRRELILVHEIAADGGVIQSGVDVKQYQFLLISKIVCTGGLLPVANHFRTSELRKRIVSMKKKTSRTAALKLLLLVPLVAAALAVFARTHYVAADSETAQPTETAPEKEQLYLPFGNSFRLAAEYVERVVPTTGRTRLMHGVLELNESDRRTKTRLHNGIDIVPENDTLRSPYSGVVNSAVSGQGYGNKLVISHAEALQTVYLHLAGFLVSEGETVKGGQPIAIVGNTGASVAKHLHFETLVNGKHVDPMKTLFGIETGASGTAIDKGGMISLNIPGAK
jgi:biotin carboxyl carrier protein